MIHVAPLLRSRLRFPAGRRPPGPHGFVCLPQARGGGQVDPDHERAPVCRRGPAGATTAEPFSPEALYELRIDTDGDAVADITYRVRFSPSEDGSQTATLHRLEGAQAAGTGDSGKAIVEGAPVSTGRDARVTEAGEYRFFAGWRSNPFFFDTEGILNNLQFTGSDFFADKNVCGIVLEVPNSDLGATRVNLWACTLIGTAGDWVQVDRGALPAQAVFLVGTERDAYMAGEPADDDRFVSVFAHSLEHTVRYAPEEAERAAHAPAGRDAL